MKYLHFVTTMFLLMSGMFFTVSAQNTTPPVDSVKYYKDSVLKLNKVLEKNATEITQKTAEITELKTKVAQNNCVNVTLSKTAKTIVFTPLLLLLLFTIIFMIWMARSKFTLEDALSIAPTTEQYEKAQAANLKLRQAGALAATVPDPKPQPSVSRLLAFLTGISAIIIAICLVSYHGYSMVTGCNNEKQFEAIWKILVGLGIGVIPYGINVWNGNGKEQTSSTPKS